MLERRVLACWRTRASMAGLCAGVLVFLLGAGAAVPLSLNAAWLASLAALPACVLAAWAARRRMGVRMMRPRALLLALVLELGAVFLLASLVCLAGQSLILQAQPVRILLAAFAGAALCALSGGAGLARLCFGLRYALPLCAGALCAVSLGLPRAAGPWPLLGGGAPRLLVSCLCMGTSALPALLLLLPPPELEAAGEDALRCPMPGWRFFALRMALGAACGAILLFAVCVCSGYESLAAQHTWGDRLRILSSAQPREGTAQTLLTCLQVMAIALAAGCLLSGAEQALDAASERLKRGRLGLLLAGAPVLLLLLAMSVYGYDAALYAAPLLGLPAAALLMGKGKRA